MKNQHLICAVIIYALTSLLYSCQTIADEKLPTEECRLKITTKKTADIAKATSRKDSVCLYIYNSKDKLQTTSQCNIEEEFDLKLPQDNYTIIAISGMPEEYIGKKMNLDDAIKMGEKNISPVPIFYGRTSANLKKKTHRTIVHMQSTMARMKIKISGIREAESVKLKLADICSELSFDGNCNNECGISTIDCHKEGFDYMADIYMLPSLHNYVPISIEVEKSAEIKNYSYRLQHAIKANTPYEIIASYSEGTGIEGNFIIEDWESPVIINIDFGPGITDGQNDTDNENENDKDDEGGETNPQIPEIGTIWKGGLVTALSSDNKYVLLMSVEEWYGNIYEFDTAPDYSAGEHKWHIPTDTEAKAMAQQIMECGIDNINTALRTAKGDELDTDQRHLCLKKEEFYTYKFSKSQRITKAGEKKEYSLRLVTSIKIN